MRKVLFNHKVHVNRHRHIHNVQTMSQATVAAKTYAKPYNPQQSLPSPKTMAAGLLQATPSSPFPIRKKVPAKMQAEVGSTPVDQGCQFDRMGTASLFVPIYST